MERLIHSLRLGLTAALLLGLSACSSSGDGNSPGGMVRQFPNVTPYVSDSPWAAVMKDCVNVDNSSQSCKIADLPPIGYEIANPTVDDVMDRVLVSHRWMGEHFEQMLRSYLPADVLTLMRSVTVIVIDKDVRPSYYWTVTGAIHLDPAYLWLTAEDKAVIAQAADYRSDFGKDLQFEFYSRYLLNGLYAWDYYRLDNDTERSYEDIRYSLARLLYHELAHANDFMPASQLGTLNPASSFWDSAIDRYNTWLSERLYSSNEGNTPLLNETLGDLADVRWGGVTATETQSQMHARDVGGEFASEGAAHFYGYYTLREDLAMLFEAAQMKRHFNIDMEVATVIKPTSGDGSCDESDWLIGWGEQGRLASAQVRDRARTAAQYLLPDAGWDQFFLGLGTSIDSVENSDWCELRPNIRSFGQHIDPIEWQRANAIDPRHLIDLY